jgi:hypothetical protein
MLTGLRIQNSGANVTCSRTRTHGAEVTDVLDTRCMSGTVTLKKAKRKQILPRVEARQSLVCKPAGNVRTSAPDFGSEVMDRMYNLNQKVIQHFNFDPLHSCRITVCGFREHTLSLHITFRFYAIFTLFRV